MNIILNLKIYLYYINKLDLIIIKPHIHIFTFILFLSYHKLFP